MRILSRAKAKVTETSCREGSLRIMPDVSRSGSGNEAAKCERHRRRAAFPTEAKGAEQTANSKSASITKRRKDEDTKNAEQAVRSLFAFVFSPFLLFVIDADFEFRISSFGFTP
jgi:hypothetical protein